MRLLLCFTLFVLCATHVTEAVGATRRRYVRRAHHYPPMLLPRDRFVRRNFQIFPRPWPRFLFSRRPPRSPWAIRPPQPLRRRDRRMRFDNERMDRVVPQDHHQQPSLRSKHPPRPPRPMFPGPPPPRNWRPLDFGNPVYRDPTIEYAPPAEERVQFITESRSRSVSPKNPISPATPNNPRPQLFSPRPPPNARNVFKRPFLWKMLAHKQRVKRPLGHIPRGPPPRYHGQSPSAPLYHHQVHNGIHDVPKRPNFIYFKPSDVMPKTRRPGPPSFFRPVPPGEEKWPAEFSSVETDDDKPKGSPGGNKEYLFTVVGFRGPTRRQPLQQIPTTKSPQILHAVRTTPVTITTTHNTAVKPFEPTESIDNVAENHKDVVDQDTSGSEDSDVIVHKAKTQPPEPDSPLDSLDMIPPAPIFPNSFNILDSGDSKPSEPNQSDESSDARVSIQESKSKVAQSGKKPRPVFNNSGKKYHEVLRSTESYKTSTSVSVSISKTDEDEDSKTPKPPPSTTKATTTTTSTSTTRRSTSTPKSMPEVKSVTIKTSSTPKPVLRKTTEKEESIADTSSTTTEKPFKFPRLPTMPTYKRRPTPVYAKRNRNKKKSGSLLGKYSSSLSSSALSKDMSGSGEIVVITGGRSKVKEYKPQFIGDDSKLLSFDKVDNSSAKSTKTSHKGVPSSTASPSTTTTTTKSPLQEFDPMQLLHSWFTKPSSE